MFNAFGRLVGGGEIISDRMSYRNHYMCSGEATSVYDGKITRLKVLELAKLTIHAYGFSTVA